MKSSQSATRLAIVQAFNRLVLKTRRARPSVAELLRASGVARSTLYEHFDSRDTLLLAAMEGPLSVVADAALDLGREDQLRALLDHFWEQRKGAAEVLSPGPFAARIARTLADLMLQRLERLDRADALRIAETQLAFIRLWISGETPCTAGILAEKMILTARAQLTAFGLR